MRPVRMRAYIEMYCIAVEKFSPLKPASLVRSGMFS